MTTTRPADTIVVALGGAILAATAALALLAATGIDPLAGTDLCWSRILLGRDCPGCGLTRSFVAIGGGNLARAFALNPTGPLLFAATALLTALHALRLGGVPLRRLGTADAVVGATAVALLLARAVEFYLV